jgi:hypothetical protein
MATWKRLGRIMDNSVVSVDVNTDCIAFMFRSRERTDLHFVGGGREGKEMLISVKETPEEIQMATAVTHG